MWWLLYCVSLYPQDGTTVYAITFETLEPGKWSVICKFKFKNYVVLSPCTCTCIHARVHTCTHTQTHNVHAHTCTHTPTHTHPHPPPTHTPHIPFLPPPTHTHTGGEFLLHHAKPSGLTEITLLGYNKLLGFTSDSEGLHIMLPILAYGDIQYAWTFKLTQITPH